VVVRPAGLRVHPDDAPQRVEPPGDVREREVGARGLVVRHVDVRQQDVLVGPVEVHIVGRERRVAGELPLHADRRLPHQRHAGELRIGRELAQVTEETAGHVSHVAEPIERLLEGRPRPVERAHREVGPPVGLHADERHLLRQLRPVERRRRDVRVVQAGPAADDRPVVERIGEAEPRLDVVGVLRAVGRHPRLERPVLRKGVPDQVVPQPEVQRQAVGDVPVVLDPGAELRQQIGTIEAADPDLVALHERVDERQVPGVGVQRVREDRPDLGLGRARAAARRVDAHAVVAEAPGMEVLAAELQVVPAPRVVREREVVADRRDLLLPRPGVQRAPLNLEAAEPDAAGRRG